MSKISKTSLALAVGLLAFALLDQGFGVREDAAAVWGAAISSVFIIQIWKGLSPNEWSKTQKLFLLGIVATVFSGGASGGSIPAEFLLGSIAVCLAGFFFFDEKKDG